MPHVVIVGAGISGLSAAYRLQQAMSEAEITVLEQSSRPGGTVWTLTEQGFRFEAGPNGFLDTKPTTLQLARDLDLGDRLVAADQAVAKNRYLFLGDGLLPLPGGLVSFLRSPLLSWRGKIALLLERFRRRGVVSVDESIATFARRRAGKEVAGVLADAMVTGIFAGDPELLSMPACFPRLAALEREHGSVLKGLARSARLRRAEAKVRGEMYQRPGRLWSFCEGLGLLIDSLCAKLRKPPVLSVAVRTIQLARRVSEGDARPSLTRRAEDQSLTLPARIPSLARRAGASEPLWEVIGDDGRSWQADAVILACPAFRQAALLAELDRELAKQIGAIPYNRVTVVALGYRRQDIPIPVDGFGFIAPQRTRGDVLGVQWCSSLYPDRAPANMVLLRALCGGWHRPDVAAWEEQRLLQAVREELRRAMKITAAPVFSHVIRWDRAIPQYHVGHLIRVAAIEERLTQHPGLFLGGNAYRGVALNDCTEQGQILATRVKRFLTRPS